MHYYSFNIGDYKKKTGHLSVLEHGVYRLLIDFYYESEMPIPKNGRTIMRKLGIRSKQEKEAYEIILEEFFTLTPDGYRNETCDKWLEKIYKKSESARKSAKARWKKDDANASNDNANASESDANTMRTVCESNATPINTYITSINTELTDEINFDNPENQMN